MVKKYCKYILVETQANNQRWTQGSFVPFKQLLKSNEVSTILSLLKQINMQAALTEVKLSCCPCP